MRNTTAATGREPIIPAGSESLPASQRDAAQTQAASTSPVNGTFQQPPTPGATWVPGTYDPAARQWTDGHWEQTGAPRR